MAPVTLSAAFSSNLRTDPVLHGRVVPQGISLCCSELHPSEIFWRQLRFQEFDVSEMSMSSFLISRDHGDDSFIALPVFTTRGFFHTGILVRDGSGIDRPEDLAGKRVGVPEYQQTGAVWSRGVLQDEFGVRPTEIHWFMERSPERSHGGVTGFQPPPGVEFDYIASSSNIGQMLLEGELDATLLYIPSGNLVDRSRADLNREQSIRRLFPNTSEEGIRYHRATGLLHLNHCIVVRRTVAEHHPWILLNLFDAFVEAKQQWLADVARHLAPYEALGVLDRAQTDLLRGTDPFPYGIRAQRDVLETLARYCTEQGLTSEMPAVEQLFAAVTRDF